MMKKLSTMSTCGVPSSYVMKLRDEAMGLTVKIRSTSRLRTNSPSAAVLGGPSIPTYQSYRAS